MYQPNEPYAPVVNPVYADNRFQSLRDYPTDLVQGSLALRNNDLAFNPNSTLYVPQVIPYDTVKTTDYNVVACPINIEERAVYAAPGVIAVRRSLVRYVPYLASVSLTYNRGYSSSKTVKFCGLFANYDDGLSWAQWLEDYLWDYID